MDRQKCPVKYRKKPEIKLKIKEQNQERKEADRYGRGKEEITYLCRIESAGG
ncbi:hypothetical protein [Mediterraneibacter gnavus]|jgi:hypothetical protein|uniref:hypothetical protein n=1 Tax=Mediterraneibacter gnavus TaxID=33038 RepID=UPI00232E7E0F|nr:hypothetical protein [Mediterraneibacter gnavus]MDB8679804.1 hypothetical protein [Mediterraneibacter gnavus]MDB8690987.1 hypothetical protein [Mediterraneibacter gnavus]